MMDIFIELTATIMQNFLIIWFISDIADTNITE